MRYYEGYFQQGINYYVPAMHYHSELNLSHPTRVNFGKPAAGAAAGVMAATAITTGGNTFDVDWTADAEYGRSINVLGGTLGDNAVVTVRGFDYLGQPMQENLTLNGTTVVVGRKAFKRVTQVVTGANAQASTLRVDTSDRLGLRFAARRIMAEYSNRNTAAVGTFVAPDYTDPATATTGDPRGTYDPSTALNGTNEIEVDIVPDPYMNDDGNGGLHGIKHFYAA